MIVRILEDRQYELDDDQTAKLSELDQALESSVASGDERAFATALAAVISAARNGTVLDPSVIVPSDLILPSEDATVEEVRRLLSSETIEL